MAIKWLEHLVSLASETTKNWSNDHHIGVTYNDPCIIIKRLEHRTSLTSETYEGHKWWPQGDS